MRKAYVKPLIEVESYALDQSIAGNCGNVVTLGPGDYNDNVCKEFEGDDDVIMRTPGSSLVLFSTGTSFYNGTNGPACSCYYTSGGQGYFTS